MEQKQFIKQLFLNLDINKELLYKAIEDKYLEEKIIIYQYLSGNLPQIPQVVKNDKDETLIFEKFNPFDDNQICYYKTTERKIYFKKEEDLSKYNGCKYEDIPYNDYELSKTPNYSIEGTCIYKDWCRMPYNNWIKLAKQ